MPSRHSTKQAMSPTFQYFVRCDKGKGAGGALGKSRSRREKLIPVLQAPGLSVLQRAPAISHSCPLLHLSGRLVRRNLQKLSVRQPAELPIQ